MQTPRQRYLKRWGNLKKERASWDDHWRELEENIRPGRARLLTNEQNDGKKKHSAIINSTPIRAHRVLASGMMAGVTSPARPWFRLTTPDPALAELGSVRSWLHLVEERLRSVFARSNIYMALFSVYEDLGQFGTAMLFLEEDAEKGLRAYNLPVGQYALANNSKLLVDSLFRELKMTVAQLVEEFGEDNCSQHVKEMYQRGDLDEWVKVLHVVEPNRDFTEGVIGPKGMRFKSCWMELEGDVAGMLREKGYEEFPGMAPRWTVTGEDIYGRCPGMDALGDAKALQLFERRKAQAVTLLVDPPTNAPSSMRNRRVSMLPGHTNYVDVSQGGQRIEPAIEINPQTLPAIGAEIREVETSINAAFYADLWLSLTNTDRRQITAREVAERHEEKMMQLGPVLERLQVELLDPLIDRAFAILLRMGWLPPVPEELLGIEIRVEYTSILAQAQKLLSISGIERVASFVGNLAAARPDVLDKLNTDEMVDSYAESVGIAPDMINSDEVVAAIRKARAEAKEAEKQAAAAMSAAQGAKTLSETDLQGDTALNRLMGSLGGTAPGRVGVA